MAEIIFIPVTGQEHESAGTLERIWRSNDSGRGCPQVSVRNAVHGRGARCRELSLTQIGDSSEDIGGFVDELFLTNLEHPQGGENSDLSIIWHHCEHLTSPIS
jgi:hypothetical protein